MRFTAATVAAFLATTSACDMHDHTHSDNRQLETSLEAFQNDPFSRCGARHLLDDEKELSNEIAEDWHFFNERRLLRSNKSYRYRKYNKAYKAKKWWEKKWEPIEIDVVIHVVRDSNGNGPTSQMIDDQMDVLNDAYAPFFQFSVIDSTETVNDAWFGSRPRDANDLEMKSQLHVGGAEVMNLYFGGFQGLGGASFPWELEETPEYDGVTIWYLTMPGAQIPPGSPLERFNQGKTIIHETGHWLGLFHTFEGESCEGPGDFVRDTSTEAEASIGCPVGKDTCPGQGPDPVHNYMNYSDDSCIDNFTPGQIQRMIAHYKVYRDPDPKSARFVSCARKLIGKTRCKNRLQCCGGTCKFCTEN